MATALVRRFSFAVRGLTRFKSTTSHIDYKDYKGEEYDPNKKIVPSNQVPQRAFDPEVDETSKTTVTVVNQESKDIFMVDAFSSVGFTLNNGMHVLGPTILFAKALFQWKVADIKSLTPEAFTLFYLLEPKLDILVIGYGNKGEVFDRQLLHQLMKKRKMGVEILPTEQAISTFNWLINERRYVGGAFIPPSKVDVTDEDLYERFQMHSGDTDQGFVKKFGASVKFGFGDQAKEKPSWDFQTKSKQETDSNIKLPVSENRSDSKRNPNE